jgi:hypothetical protein
VALEALRRSNRLNVTEEALRGLDKKMNPTQHAELVNKVHRFLEILDIKEETDAGNWFKPVRISSVRVLLDIEIEKLLKEMRLLTNYRKGSS